ncbi:unnamed protein product [Phytophthora lilii]|uniref:Unnamed protein product n=1 Tax=Phytophthora lilii TaxID=2077276 RepID=A0A9W6U6E6_9STRA|nr:unnamed protein product [Phytophthora lilii]
MEPRPLLELNVEQAIAGILQKPRWWIKSQDPEICWKWMSEVEYQFLTTTFQQSLVNWSHGQGPILDLNDLLVEPEGPEKQTKLREWLKGIVTEFGMDGEADEEYSDLESVSDDDEEKTEEKQEDIEEVADNDGVKDLSEDEARKLRALKLKVSAQESYPTIKWTLNQLLLHEELSRTPVEEWTTDTIHHALDQAEHLSHPALISRATELVIAVRRGVSIHEALSIPPGSDLLSADRLLELKLHCEKIQRELSSVKAYIMRSLFLIAEKEGLRADTASEKIVFCPAGIDGVWISDNLIPQDVATKFIKEVAVLENVPDDKKDWHPHSNRQVLDLVHPSLFCCVFGQTMRVPNALDPSSYTTPSEQMHRLMFLGSKPAVIEEM